MWPKVFVPSIFQVQRPQGTRCRAENDADLRFTEGFFPYTYENFQRTPEDLACQICQCSLSHWFCSLEWFLDVFSFSFSALVVLVLLVFLLNETGCRTMSSPWSAQDSREYAARRFGRSGKQLCLTKRQSCSWQSWTSLRL